MTNPAVFISSSSEGLPLARELGQRVNNSKNRRPLRTGGKEHSFLAKVFPNLSRKLRIDQILPSFFLTGDDTSNNRVSTRNNITFELGYFVGRLGLSRIFVIYDTEEARLPSDLAGTLHIPVSINDSSAIARAAAVIRQNIATIGVRPDRSSSRYHSCFISYSWKDQEFAARLYDDLRSVGIRSWLDAKEIKTGALLGETVDKAIEAHDKLILILSQASIRSSWVQLEVRK